MAEKFLFKNDMLYIIVVHVYHWPRVPAKKQVSVNFPEVLANNISDARHPQYLFYFAHLHYYWVKQTRFIIRQQCENGPRVLLTNTKALDLEPHIESVVEQKVKHAKVTEHSIPQAIISPPEIETVQKMQ